MITGTGHGGVTITSGQTRVVPVAKCSVVVLYDVVDGAGGGLRSFAMRVDLHLDAGGEAGVHC